MFDISGTMWMVYLLFVYGLKSVWIPWLWPVFNQVFLMIYLSVWLRRSGVMTGAEWIKFRFGEGRGAHLSHIIVVVFALINVIGFLAYGFIGIGSSPRRSCRGSSRPIPPRTSTSTVSSSQPSPRCMWSRAACSAWSSPRCCSFSS
jgi:hypothetical protein